MRDPRPGSGSAAASPGCPGEGHVVLKGGPETPGSTPTSPTDPPGVGMVYPPYGPSGLRTRGFSRSQTLFLSPGCALGPRHLVTAPPPPKFPSSLQPGEALRTQPHQSPQRLVYEAAATRAQGLPGIVVLSLTGAWGPKVEGGGQTSRGSPGVEQLARVGQDVRLS